MLYSDDKFGRLTVALLNDCGVGTRRNMARLNVHEAS